MFERADVVGYYSEGGPALFPVVLCLCVFDLTHLSLCLHSKFSVFAARGRPSQHEHAFSFWMKNFCDWWRGVFYLSVYKKEKTQQAHSTELLQQALYFTENPGSNAFIKYYYYYHYNNYYYL